jgi:hypothetical protein
MYDANFALNILRDEIDFRESGSSVQVPHVFRFIIGRAIDNGA